MTNLQAEMFPEESAYAWEEFCYHNALVDVVSMMQRYGEGKVIMDVLNMYREAEKVKQ